jgi:hypothetical protein
VSSLRTLAAPRSACVDTRRPPSRWLLLFALAGVACADDEGAAAGDASSDVTLDVEVRADAVVSTDATAPDASVSTDATAPDASVSTDATAPDASVSPDATAPDASVSPDATAPDASVSPDATAPDASVSPDAVVRPDAALVDRAVVDATTPPDTGCAGSAPVVSVTAPARDAMIETCTESGARVYYDFRATVTATGAVRQVTAQWRTPDGAIAPPPPPPLTAAPYVWRRQVGGMMVDVPPLAILGGALRGTWHFDVTATDACGRSTTVAQPFSLIFTTRRCPNP